MATTKPIRFGAIGPGNAGTHRIRELAAHPLGLQVVAAADVRPERLDNLENVLGYSFARYTGPQDFRRMIDECDLDAVGVFTPHSLHYEHVKYAIEQGKHVLIEKPMVCGTDRAVEVTRLLEAKGTVGVIHYQRHYEAKFLKAKEMIAKGMIGELQTFFVYMAQDWKGGNWRGDPQFSGGGQVNDSGSHYQDILLWMTGLAPVSAEGSLDYYHQGTHRPIPISGSFNVELSNGAGGRVLIMGDTVGGFCDDVRLRGTEGDIMFYGDRLLHRPKGKEIAEITCTLPKGYPTSPCDNFVKLIRGKVRKNRVPFIFGVRVACLTDAMLRAGEAGTKVVCADLLKSAGMDPAELL